MFQQRIWVSLALIIFCVGISTSLWAVEATFWARDCDNNKCKINYTNNGVNVCPPGAEMVGAGLNNIGNRQVLVLKCRVGNNPSTTVSKTTEHYWARYGCGDGDNICGPVYTNNGVNICPPGAVMVGAGLVINRHRQVLELKCQKGRDLPTTHMEWTPSYWARRGCGNGGNVCGPIYTHRGVINECPAGTSMVGAGLVMNAGNQQQVKIQCHDNTSFTMAFMADPQFYWGCSSSPNTSAPSTTNDYCKIAANKAKSDDDQAKETNNQQIESIKSFVNSDPNFQGIVINGDLTEFGDQDDRWKTFKSFYNSLNIGTANIWPGLGNHDYQNPVNDCGTVGTQNYNNCAANMVQNFASEVIGGIIPRGMYEDSYDIPKFDENTAQAGSIDHKNVTGSLAYSWNIGDFHFIQLNNYPTYTKSFYRGWPSGVSSWDYVLESSLPWLIKDLKKNKQLPNPKKVILNWHQWGEMNVNTRNALKPYKEQIKAIFVGHAHSYFGYLGDNLKYDPPTTPTPSTSSTATKIPVIYSGSPIWSRYIKATFSTGRNAAGNVDTCTIITQVINSLNSGHADANNSKGENGLHQIDCL
jgi:hypothetical protein